MPLTNAQATDTGIIDPFDLPGSGHGGQSGINLAPPNAAGSIAAPPAADSDGIVDPFDLPGSGHGGPRRTVFDTVKEKTDPRAWESMTTIVKDLFTGESRETRASRELPELLNFSGLLSDVSTVDTLKMAPALVTAFDPNEQADIIQANVPQIRRQHDEKGNIILFNENTGAYAMVNKPGLSPTDLYQGTAVAAEFYPAAGFGGGKSTFKNAMKVGFGSGAVETANQSVQAASGGDFNAGEIGLVSVGGAFFDSIGAVVAKALSPVWNRARQVTPEIREAFKASATNAGLPPDAMTDDIIKGYMKAVGEGAPEGEFGIRYTKGQASKDPVQLSSEEFLRKNSKPKARQTMAGFADDQTTDILDARKRLNKAMGDSVPIDSTSQAGEIIADGIKTKAQVARNEIVDIFKDAANAKLSTEGQKGLTTRLRFLAMSNVFETDPVLAPATNKAIKELDGLAQNLKSGSGETMRFALLQDLRGSLKKWQNMAANETDRNQILELKRTYDRYIKGAVDNAMFDGDKKAIASLKQATGLHDDYVKTFTRLDKTTRSGGEAVDTAGDLIERMAERNPSPDGVINFIFGTSDLGRKKDAASAVVRIKRIVGPKSDEFTALRQAAFLRLTDPGKGKVFSGDKMEKVLLASIKNQPTLINSLFKKAEQAEMLRFARAVKKAQPVARVSTAPAASSVIADSWGKVTTALGFGYGGTPGAVIANRGAEAAKQISSWRATAKAAQATSQIKPLNQLRLGIVASMPPGRETTGEAVDTAGDYLKEKVEARERELSDEQKIREEEQARRIADRVKEMLEDE